MRIRIVVVVLVLISIGLAIWALSLKERSVRCCPFKVMVVSDTDIALASEEDGGRDIIEDDGLDPASLPLMGKKIWLSESGHSGIIFANRPDVYQFISAEGKPGKHRVSVFMRYGKRLMITSQDFELGPGEAYFFVVKANPKRIDIL